MLTYHQNYKMMRDAGHDLKGCHFLNEDGVSLTCHDRDQVPVRVYVKKEAQQQVRYFQRSRDWQQKRVLHSQVVFEQVLTADEKYHQIRTEIDALLGVVQQQLVAMDAARQDHLDMLPADSWQPRSGSHAYIGDAGHVLAELRNLNEFLEDYDG